MNFMEDLIDDLPMSRIPLPTTITTARQRIETQLEKDARYIATRAGDFINELELSLNYIRKTMTTGERGSDAQIGFPVVQSRASSHETAEGNIQDGEISPSPTESLHKDPNTNVHVTPTALSDHSASPGEKNSKSDAPVVALGSSNSPYKASSEIPAGLGTLLRKGDQTRDQTNDRVRCDACGRSPITGPPFRSAKIMNHHLCLLCFESMDAKKNEYTMVGPAIVRRRCTFSPGHPESISAETAGVQTMPALADEGLPLEKRLLAKLERLGFKDQKLNGELLEKNNFDVRKTLGDLCAEEETNLTPGEPQEFENGQIALSAWECLQKDPIASVDFTTDISRDFASHGESKSSWNAVIASDCIPSNCETLAETPGPFINRDASQAHDGIICEACGRRTPFRSGSILNYNLCLQCFETRARKNNPVMCPKYFGHPTLVERKMDASSPPQLQADSAENPGGEEPTHKVAHEVVISRVNIRPNYFGHPTLVERILDVSSPPQLQADSAETPGVAREGVLSKLEALGSKDEELNAELLGGSQFVLCDTMDDLDGADEDWDPISGELEELGFYDYR